MFNINDTVMYGSQSVCKITDITEKIFIDKSMQYYVLEPVYENRSTIFVPVDNQKLIDRMHRVLSAEEIYQIIHAIPNERLDLIDDENSRKERYSEIVASGDRMELMKLIKTLYLHGEKRKESGKKLNSADEHVMKSAEKILYDEFALVLNISRDDVIPMIAKQIDVAAKH